MPYTARLALQSVMPKRLHELVGSRVQHQAPRVVRSVGVQVHENPLHGEGLHDLLSTAGCFVLNAFVKFETNVHPMLRSSVSGPGI